MRFGANCPCSKLPFVSRFAGSLSIEAAWTGSIIMLARTKHMILARLAVEVAHGSPVPVPNRLPYRSGLILKHKCSPGPTVSPEGRSALGISLSERVSNDPASPYPSLAHCCTGRTNTSPLPLVSVATGRVALLVNATKRPSALMHRAKRAHIAAVGPRLIDINQRGGSGLQIAHEHVKVPIGVSRDQVARTAEKATKRPSALITAPPEPKGRKMQPWGSG